jgi:hypothetical protein
MISSQYCNILHRLASPVKAEPILFFVLIRSDIDVRICAAQHPLKSIYPTRQDNLSLRHADREMHRYFAEVVFL